MQYTSLVLLQAEHGWRHTGLCFQLFILEEDKRSKEHVEARASLVPCYQTVIILGLGIAQDPTGLK